LPTILTEQDGWRKPPSRFAALLTKVSFGFAGAPGTKGPATLSAQTTRSAVEKMKWRNAN
jgi:hypothetical protein